MTQCRGLNFGFVQIGTPTILFERMKYPVIEIDKYCACDISSIERGQIE